MPQCTYIAILDTPQLRPQPCFRCSGMMPIASLSVCAAGLMIPRLIWTSVLNRTRQWDTKPNNIDLISSLYGNCSFFAEKLKLIFTYKGINTENLYILANNYIDKTQKEDGYLPGLQPDIQVQDVYTLMNTYNMYSHFMRNIAVVLSLEYHIHTSKRFQKIWYKSY